MSAPRRRRALAVPDLRPYLHVGGLARPFAVGTVILLRRAGAWCMVSKGSVGYRIGGVVFGLVCAGEAVVMYPAGAPSVLAGAWVVTALVLASKVPAQARPSKAANKPADKVVEPSEKDLLLDLLDALIGDDNGVHFQALYPAMRGALPGLSEAPDEALREVLRRHGIPTRRAFRAGGVPGRSGVHWEDLPSPTAPGPLSAPLSAPEEAGQSGSALRVESGRRVGGEHFSGAVTVAPDPSRGANYYRVESS